MSAPAATTAGLMYFPGIGGAHVLLSDDGSLAMFAAIRRVCRLSLPLQSLKKDNSGLANWLLFDRHERSDKSGAFAGS